MSDQGEVRLRDRRRPGHCWQDNELYDVFQPIIGPHGVALYANLSRMAYGASFEYSARGLEEVTGMSRMTVWRTMAVLEHLGMVRAKAGRGRAKGECVLVDLKELAEALGARPIQNGNSHELLPAVRERLKKECVAVRASLGRASAEAAPACVPVGDANSGGNLPFCVPVGDASGTVVSQNEGVCVPPGGHASFSVSKHKTTKQVPTPTPPQAEGVLLDGEANRVAETLRFTAKAVRRAIRDQLEQARKRSPEVSTVGLADAMIQRWRDYSALGEFLRFTWGPRRFFSEGHWANDDLWPVDWARYSMRQGARVGMA